MEYRKYLDPEAIIPISRASTEVFGTGSWSRSRPVFAEKSSPCRAACPTGNNISLALHRASQGDYDGALSCFLEESPLPGVCGRVCYHSCQESCNRIDLDGSVNVRAIERAVSEKGAALPEPLTDAGKGLAVAVIGSGPAGLAAAYHLARMGHPVTLVEARDRLGGLLAGGLPSYRLPEEVFKRDLERILSLDIEVATKQSTGPAELEKLLAGYRAVVLATGTWAPTPMGIPGEELPGVLPGLDFLLDEELQAQARGRSVVVVGGGNTAIDAARVALRRGAAKVTVVYRRDRKAMPAFADEVREAEEEGIDFRFLSAPAAFLGQEGRVGAVACRGMRSLAALDGSRAGVEPEPGSEFEVPCDLVLTAIGQSMGDASLIDGLVQEAGRIPVDRQGRTARPGLYAAGDVSPAKATVVDAMASGKRVAATIHLDLTGRAGDVDAALLGKNGAFSIRTLFQPRPDSELGALAEVDEFSYLTSVDTARQCAPRLDPAQRISGFDEVVGGLSERETEAEAERCFFCGTCIGCDCCATSCPEVSMGRADGRTAYESAQQFCKGCGACASVCVRGVLKMGEE